MKFDDLDVKMRAYETAHDFCVPSEIYMVARIDGRAFTRLTKEVHDFERPFDFKFRDMMVETVKHLMNCGFQVIYGYTESDEISLLFDLKEATFSRKVRKFNSILAGEASAKFSLQLQDLAAFDCRISQLPNLNLVIDYFRWRHEDAHRNALNAHCYWLLRNEGKRASEASKLLNGKSIAYKNEFLFSNGINFNDLPSWQKRGIGFSWKKVEKEGWNPVQNKMVSTIRREIQADMELPIGEDYSDYLLKIIQY